jgi:hypothetical protein
MAFNNRNTQYISSSKYTAVAQWAASHSYSFGNLVRQLATPSYGNERVFMCYVAGTSGGSEPSWSVTGGSETTGDGGVSWIDVTGAAALNGDLGNTPNWVAGHGNNPSTGQIVKDAAGTHAFICTVSGSAGSSEPSWNTSAVGNSTTDSGVTWLYIGTAGTLTKWAAPHARMYTATQGNFGNNGAIGIVNQFFIGNNHAENTGSNSVNISWGQNHENGGPAVIVCVNESGNVPPQASDITTGASITNANGTFGMSGWFTLIGLQIIMAAAGQINVSFQNNTIECINCDFKFTSTNNNCYMTPSYYQSGKTIYRNCTVEFGGSGQYMQCNGTMRWYGGSIGLTGTQITNQGIFQNGNPCDWVFKGVDFSGVLGTGAYFPQFGGTNGEVQIRFEDCKMPSGIPVEFWDNSVTVTNIYGAASNTAWIEFLRCGADWQYAKFNIQAWVITTAKANRHSGANDGTTSFAWRVVTGIQSNSASYVDPQPGFFECPPLAVWNANVGSPAVTVDVYGVSFGTVMPDNSDVWLEVDYMGGAAGTVGTRKNSGRCPFLTTPTSLATDSSGWSDNAPARQNSHAYNAGDYIADPASNGRIYCCTTSGTSASSLPGGYSSAVDGSVITDGSAHFTAGWRFVVSLTLTGPEPAQAGIIDVTVCFGGPQNVVTQYLIDPQPVL